MRFQLVLPFVVVSLAVAGCSAGPAFGQPQPATAQNITADQQGPSNEATDSKTRAAPQEDAVPTEVREEAWPSGSPKSRSEGYVDAEENFIRHGLTTTWYESGQVNSKTQWKDGVPHGERTTWYFHGQMWANGQYVDGLEDGTWTRWHQNGEKHSEWHMDRGAWDGFYREWHDNGKPRLEVEFINGLRQGPQFMWDEQGVLIQTSDYTDGVEQP